MAAYAKWQFVLTDLAGVQIGEVLDCPQRQVIRSLSATSVASFTIFVTNRLLADVLTRDLNLKVYRNGVLLFHGPVVSAELATDDASATPTVRVGAADPSWRFTKRLCGKSAGGTLFNGTDRLTIAETLITSVSGNLAVNTLGQTCGSTSVYVAGPMKPLDQCIQELAQTLNGFDWRIDPIEYQALAGDVAPFLGRIGNFKAAATLGAQQPSAVFEYQGKANARLPNYQRNITDIANRVFSISDGGPAAVNGILFSEDTASQNARGLYEELVDTSGIANATLRNAIQDDHILYRKNPKQVVSFSPDFNDYSGRVPEYGQDYQIGDSVRASIIYNGVRLVDGFVRLYRMQFDIDDNGRETLTPTVVNES